jgi:hypothetical protein
MATTVTAATFTSKITEAITLNGVDQGGEQTLTISSVTEVSRRIVEVGTTEIILLAFQATDPGPGAFDEADVRYIRITNLDDTNHVTLIFRSGTAECAHKLDAGHTFIYAGDNSGGVAATHDASSTALTVSLATLDDITAQANTAACDLEYMVVGV